MAWPVATAYTAPEKAKVKADIDEAVNIVKATADKYLSVNGKMTRAEEELRKIQTQLETRSSQLV